MSRLENPWIDISVNVREGMPLWPDDPGLRLDRVMDQTKGDVCTLTRASMSAHTGTHMDAPLHFVAHSRTIDTMPIEATVGPARVIHIKDQTAIHREELLPYGIQAGERILFRTRNSERDWQNLPFDEEFVYIARDGAEYLAECGVRSVGVDYLSVGGFKVDSVETHVALLGKGIWVMEGLRLAEIEAGDYELVCLPLKWVGCEGAPARAILRRAESAR
ncbi:MAG TPA: cyclase family protein [Bryobacteraceae bacterium]|nr:cyclase family protein [Bryobacteraceae bacterium]